MNENGIAINVNSQKALNSVVGHEITHVLEGTELYGELTEWVKKYANIKEKDGYNNRLKQLISLYQNVEGYKGAEGMAKIHQEAVADLVGDFLFTDPKFLQRLLENRNLFQRLWDEIKYLATVTSGTRRLAELQRAFEKAYNGETKKPTQEGGVKYSLNDAKIPTKEELSKKEPIKVVDISTPQTKGTFAERRVQILNSASDIISKPYLNKDTGAMIFLTEKSYTHAFSNSGDIQLNATEHLPELIENAVLTHAEKTTHGSEYANGIYTFFAAAKADRIRPVKLKVKEYAYKGQELPKNIKAYFDGSPEGYAASYDTVVLEVEEIEKSPSGSAKDMNQNDPFLSPDELSTIKVADLLELVKGNSEKYIPKFSQSDSDGRQLSEGQVAYFKDSKARDENGNLLVMYHGSPIGGIHVFDPGRSDDGTSIFFTDSPGVAETYSGENTIYEAQAVQTIDELNRYLAEMDKEDGLFVEKSGNEYLFKMEDGYIAGKSESLQGIYDVCCNWLRGGYGVNNKVYLNLTNPFVVDAKGKNWDDITYYEDLPEALKSFYPNGLWRRGSTREIAQYAKEHDYDGVIFKNVMDNGGFLTDSGGISTVAVAFDSNQIKSVRNTNPTSDPDVRYSMSDKTKTEKAEGWQIKGEDVLLQQEADANGLVWENGVPFRKDLLEQARKRQNGEFSIAPPYFSMCYHKFLEIKLA